MRFKTRRVEREWRQLLNEPHLCRKIVPVMVYADEASRWATGYDCVVTNILRTREEQEAICRLRNVPFYTSVHQLWRGFDLEIANYTDEQAVAICSRVNHAFSYGRGKVVLAIHTEGTARHLHGQVPDDVATWQ